MKTEPCAASLWVICSFEDCVCERQCVLYFYFHRCHWEIEAAGHDSRRERMRAVCRWRGLVELRSPGSTSAEAEWRTLHWTAGTILSEETKGLLLLSYILSTLYKDVLRFLRDHYDACWCLRLALEFRIFWIKSMQHSIEMNLKLQHQQPTTAPRNLWYFPPHSCSMFGFNRTYWCINNQIDTHQG